MLLHPDYFGRIPLAGRKLKRIIESAAVPPGEEPTPNKISIVIRAFNEAEALKRLLGDIKKQRFNGEVEIVVVDNESSDDTAEIAHAARAKVVTLPRAEFSYPRSMNVGMEAATHKIVLLTVAHTTLSHDHLLEQGAKYFAGDDHIGGVYANNLPDARASRTELIGSMFLVFLMKKHELIMPTMGTLGATGVFLHKSIWEKLGKFDERYQSGGEDGALGKKMLAAGYRIFYDPAVAVHHSHGLGPINTFKQLRHWVKTAKPQKLDVQKLVNRRPDLNPD